MVFFCKSFTVKLSEFAPVCTVGLAPGRYVLGCFLEHPGGVDVHPPLARARLLPVTSLRNSRITNETRRLIYIIQNMTQTPCSRPLPTHLATTTCRGRETQDICIAGVFPHNAETDAHHVCESVKNRVRPRLYLLLIHGERLPPSFENAPDYFLSSLLHRPLQRGFRPVFRL